MDTSISGGGSSSTLRNLLDANIVNPANGDILTYLTSNSKWNNKQPTYPSLTYSRIDLTTNINGGISWSLVDILSLALVAGTYLVLYSLTAQDTSGGERSLAVLEDPNSAHYAATFVQSNTIGTQVSNSGQDIIVLAANGTIKLRQSNGSGAAMIVEGNQTAGGLTYASTHLQAVRIV